MRCARGALQQDDPRLVIPTIVERPRVHIQRLAVVSAVADHAPRRCDAFASGKVQRWCARRGFFAGLIRIAQWKSPRLSAPERSLVHITASRPVIYGAVVVMELDNDVVAGAIAERDGPRRGLGRLRGGTGARRQVFAGVLGPGGESQACESENRQDRADGL